MRRNELRASKMMQARALADPRLAVIWNSSVESINVEERVQSLTVKVTVTDENRQVDATGPFIAIGLDPRWEPLTGQVDLEDIGYTLVEHPRPQQSPRRHGRRRPGRPPLRQATTAGDTGCQTALDAERRLVTGRSFPLYLSEHTHLNPYETERWSR